MNACTMPSFWRLPFESSRIGRSRGTPKRSTSSSRKALSTLREGGKRVELLTAGQAIVETQVAGEVTDATPGLDALRPAVSTEQRRATAGRADDVEQQANGRALAGAVRAEEAKDLSRPDAQVEPCERLNLTPIRLREPEGLDRRQARHPGHSSVVLPRQTGRCSLGKRHFFMTVSVRSAPGATARNA